MRGLIFTLDMLLGISIILLMFMSGYYLFSSGPLYEEAGFDQKKALANDFLSALSEIKVYEMYASPTLNGLKHTVLTEDEKELSVLDLVLTYWVISVQDGNLTKRQIAQNITEEIIASTPAMKDYNFSLMMGNDSVLGNYSLANRSITVSSLIENTYGSGSNYGYMARAYLNEIRAQRSRYLYFGGFVGQGNISGTLFLPDYQTITRCEFYAFSAGNVSVYVNGNLSGNFSLNPIASNFTANIVEDDVNTTTFVKGNNSIKIAFNSNDYLQSYLGGGFLRVDYTTNAFYDELSGNNSRYYFPGAEGIINVYDGIYFSSNATAIYLHYYNEIPNAEIYLNLANATLYKSNVSGEQSVLLNSTNISQAIALAGLNYSGIIGSTVPVKVGTKTLESKAGQGYGDAVLITDISGSMDTCDVDSNLTCDCDAPPPCSRARINVAKDSDEEFVNGMLNISGNRVGLVSFETSLGDFHELSENNASIQYQIDGYSASGSTCMCCGINKSLDILSQKYLPVTLVDSSGEWKYSSDYPATEPPQISGRNWTDIEYNDTLWADGNSTFGFFNKGWAYRRQLNLSNTAGNISNYPTRISINLSQEYLAGKARRYCEDVRFTAYNSTSGIETELSYFIESCNLSLSGNSTFWVKVPFIANSTATSLYIYYGNNLSIGINDVSLCPSGIRDGKCTRFFNGFEDSSGAGTNGFNTSIWSVEYGSDNNEARIQNDVGYYRTGSWAAEMEEGDEGEVAVSTKQGVLDLSDTRKYQAAFWLNLPTYTWSYGHKVYVDVYDGSWHYGVMSIDGPTYDTGNWVNFNLDLSPYNLSNATRIRIDQEGTSDYEESHIDDIQVFYGASPEPALYSIGIQESATKLLSTNLTTDIGNNGGDYYFRKTFYLENANPLVNSTVYILSDDNAEVYVNGHSVDSDPVSHNASYWNRKIILDSDLLMGGWNVIAVKLKNDDSDSAFFDLKIESLIFRKRAMLVMSDGQANYECTPHQSGEYQAAADSVQYACNARSDNITVYSVAFGLDADALTLKKVACWNCSANTWIAGESEANCSKFFQSNSENELKSIYQKIAQDIVNMSIERQAMNIIGVSILRNILYNDSFVELNAGQTMEFGEGEYLLTFEKNCTNGVCAFSKAPGVSVLEARVTSYSGDYWTDAVKVVNSSGSSAVVYNLSRYGDFERLGDPYSVSIPPQYFSNGQNNISLYLGAQNGSLQNVSRADKIVYSIKVPGYVGYGGDMLVFNSSDEAKLNATQRLIEYVESISGEQLTSYQISTSLSIEGIRKLSEVTLVRFIMW